MPPDSSRWSARTRVLFLAAPALLLFLAGEVAGRLLERYAGYMPRRAAGYLEGNPYLRTALVPGLRFRSGSFEVDVNRLGFRGPEISVPKPAGTFRIFALGESSTFGWKGARSHEEAWPARLEARLRAAHPGQAIEVVNAGVPGWTSVEQRINLMLRVSALEPDAILIYHGNNDINWSFVPEVETRLIYGRGPSIGPPGIWERLMDRSYVLMEIRSRFDLLSRSSRPRHDEVDPAALRMLRANLLGLIDDARRRGLPVAISTFAHAFDEDGRVGVFNPEEEALGARAVGSWFEYLGPEGVRRSFRAYNEMLREIAAKKSLPLVEAAQSVPKTREYHTDWCHFTRRGEERMSELWSETLERAGWFSEAPRPPGR